MKENTARPQRVNHRYLHHQRAPEVNRNGPQSISSSCCQNFSSDVLFCVLIRVTGAQCHNGTPISASVKRLQEPSPRSAAKCQINKPCAIGKCAAWLCFSGSLIVHERITAFNICSDMMLQIRMLSFVSSVCLVCCWLQCYRPESLLVNKGRPVWHCVG